LQGAGPKDEAGGGKAELPLGFLKGYSKEKGHTGGGVGSGTDQDG